MSLSRLATVELQLVMHCLDARSLLHLAQCSRHTHSASVAPFAWRHASIPTLKLADQLHLSLLRFDATPLRFCGAVRASYFTPAPRRRRRFRSNDAPNPIVLNRIELLLLARMPQLRVLDLHFALCQSSALLVRLLSGPTGARLTELQLDHVCHLSAKQAQTMMRCLPLLHTLAFSLNLRVLLPLLSLLPCLRHLSLLRGRNLRAGQLWRRSDGVPEALAACTELQSFSISRVHAEVIQAILTAAPLRSLTALTLERVCAPRGEAPVEIDWPASFANLPALTDLTVLGKGADAESLIAVLSDASDPPHCLPQLRLLSLRVHYPTDVPPASVLLVFDELLQRRPSLASLHLHAPLRGVHPAHAIDQWLYILLRMKGLHPHRLRVTTRG